jgi:hypothetical protein
MYKSIYGTLPLRYKDEKISFDAHVLNGKLIISYGWNFPPKEMWTQETRDFEECLKCLPKGSTEPSGREVWCLKLGYNFPKCPYGVKTPDTRMPVD